MNLLLPSGVTVKIEDPAKDFPKFIDEAEAREAELHADLVFLKKRAKQLAAWPVSTEAAAAEGTGAK